MASDNIISFEHSAGVARKRIADTRVRQIVGSMRNITSETVPRLIQDLFEHLDDELYALADKSASDALQTRYFEAMRELRVLRESIETSYFDARMRQYDAFWQHHAAPARQAESAEESEMSLVEEADLEEDLAITSMISKAENRFHRELFALNQRFAALLGVAEVSDTANPIGPRSLVEGFAEALSQWNGETSVKLLIYKMFDRYVMAYVGGLYDEVNDLLVSADVLPKLLQRVRRNPVAPSVQRARDPHRDPEDVSADAGSQSGEEVMSALMSLLAERRHAMPASFSSPWSFAGASNPALPEVRTEDLLGALSQEQEHTLQAEPLSLEEVQSMQAELLGSLGRNLEMGSPNQPAKRLDRNDQDVLDVMGLLFDFVLGDDNLPEAMKALLGRLQIPLLKVALSDRSFFNNTQHPARVLLNNLARAGIAWNDDGDRSANSAFGQIESAVTRILTDFVDDVSIFEAVNEQFNQYLERERRTAEVAEERVGQVKRGQEQLEMARQRVDLIIKGYRKDCQPPECVIPAPVSALLEEGWRDVLLLAYLREGEDSTSWNNACEVVEQLIWSVQPKVEQAERQQLLKSIPELLKRVRDGLVNISFDQHRSAVLFKELQSCHIAALRGASVEPVEQEETPAGPSATAQMEEAKPEASGPDDEFDQAARALQVGQLLEWQNDDGEEVRGKLSWRSEVTEICIFVNRKGMKLAEMSVQDLAQLLRDDKARVIEGTDKPLMDRALNAMLEALQKTDPAPAR